MYKNLKFVKNTIKFYERVMNKMSEITQVELQNLRHLIGAHDTAHQKLNTYANQCVDPQIKQVFTKAAQDALNTKQKLTTFLN